LLPSWFSPHHPRVTGRRTHEFSQASDHSTHCWAYRPVHREIDSLVVKVSKLFHLEPVRDIRTCNLELTLFPDVDVLCAFTDESNLSLGSSTSDLRFLESRITVATVRIDAIDARSVRSTCVHAAIVNMSVQTDGRKMPSGFAVCFKRGLVDHTIDPNSLLHDDVLGFDHRVV